MIKKYGNNLISFNSKVRQYSQNLVLKHIGSSFPNASAQTAIGSITLVFNTNAKVNIDYGNGVTVTYNTTYVGGTSWQFVIYERGVFNSAVPPAGSYASYVYPDGLNTLRLINISFDRSRLTTLNINNILLPAQDLVFGFSRYPQLRTFTIVILATVLNGYNGSFQRLDLSELSSIPFLNSVSINGAFTSTSPWYGKIPDFLFSLPLTTLGIGDAGFNSKTWTQSNMDKVALLAPSLLTFSSNIAAFSDNQAGTGEAWPSNFNLLVNLRTIIIYNALHTVIPAIVRSMSGITFLGWGFGLTSVGDISAMANLGTLSVAQNSIISTTLPVGLASCTKLKTIEYTTCFRTAARMTTFISNFYNFIVANAPMTGTSANAFRSMTIKVGELTPGDGAVIPDGVYQAPTGFVLGSSNGTPASSLERVWVMVNQYSHVWSYRSV